MAIREIVKDNEEFLHKQSRTVTAFDGRLWQLLDDMTETMHLANGVGLAAPQVGVLRRAAVVDVGDGPVEIVNPEIVAKDGVQEGSEGCLSFPGTFALVDRPNTVTVKAQDRHGKEIEITGEGFFARALCHEIGHLNGEIFLDVMLRLLTEEELEALRNPE